MSASVPESRAAASYYSVDRLNTKIGADSLGSLIFRGIYLNDQPLLLLGASLTAIVALVLDGAVAAGSRHWQARRGGAA